MQKLKGKNIVLFAPKSFGYEFEIKNAIISKGANVFLHDERPSNNTFIKAAIRIKKKLIIPYSEKYFFSILNKYKGKTIDYFLVIRGEAFTKNVLNYIKKEFPKAELILYLWDSLQNNNVSDIINYYDKVFTFDKIDAKKNKELFFRPLFFIPDYGKIPQNDSYLFDVLFIGTVHSDRFKFVKTLESFFLKNNFNTFFYFFFQSKFLYFRKKIYDSSFKKVKIKDFYFCPLAKKETIEKVSQTRIIIDIQHPNQNGLTMRTIESIGARRKLITTNKNIKEYDFYNEQNIYIVERNDTEIEKSFFLNEYINIDEKIYENYSISKWVDDLFLLNKK